MTQRPKMVAADHIRELTRGFTTVELVPNEIRLPIPTTTRRRGAGWLILPAPGTRVHHVTNLPLLDQLEATVTGSTIATEGAYGVAYGSKPAGRLDVLALLERIQRQSHDLACELGIETVDRTRTKGRHVPLRARLQAISGRIGDQPHPLVRSWWATARILTQHDGPPYAPRIPCPVETCERVGSLRVRLSERLAFCVECHTVWADDNDDPSVSFGRLAVWSTWATEHLEGDRHWVPSTGAGSYDDLGYGTNLGYDRPLGYVVVCGECEAERAGMRARKRARIAAARAAKRAA